MLSFPPSNSALFQVTSGNVIISAPSNSALFQVTSAKRTVVTVNLNMKEKENIKLNIFMNKDKEDVVKDEVESNASFPRGLTAKVARKKSAKRSSSSSGEQKGGVGKKDSLRRSSSKSPGREKPPVKEQLSSRASSAKKKRKS